MQSETPKHSEGLVVGGGCGCVCWDGDGRGEAEGGRGGECEVGGEVRRVYEEGCGVLLLVDRAVRISLSSTLIIERGCKAPPHQHI